MSDYSTAIEKLHTLQQKARGGDKQAHADKPKAANEVRAIEREAARDGTILSASMSAEGKAVVRSESATPKRELQGEYVRKFDDEKLVNVGGKEQTLRAFHSKRLLNK